MNHTEQQNIVEALLFASSEPLTQAKINLVFVNDAPELVEIIDRLSNQFEKEQRPLEIQKVAGGYQLTTKPEYETWIRRAFNKSGKLTLSQAALETLAIVAYKQPVSRYEIEAIRGVDSTGVLKTILDRSLIKIKGRDIGPGRPLLYGTTEAFLEHFGINRISDMPKLKEINELADADVESQLEAFVHAPTHQTPEIDQPIDTPSA
ncbi:MAG: SMC-Scp complex subunit ScpB [Fidelibacterota bacterium]